MCILNFICSANVHNYSLFNMCNSVCIFFVNLGVNIIFITMFLVLKLTVYTLYYACYCKQFLHYENQ